MSAIYICHSSHDQNATQALAERLRAQGHVSLFMDFDPQDGIPAGRNWERELYRQLRACQAVVVLCSARSMASDWCFAEITHARALGKHIFPILIEPCELRPLLLGLQLIDLTNEVESAYTRLWRGLETAGLDPRNVFEWDGVRPPFPGLTAFQEADASVFFGRDDSILEAMGILNRVRRFGGSNFIVCLGASGSGKSSLVRAGVLPRLRRDPESWLVVDPIRPMGEPIAALATALSDAFPETDTAIDAAALHTRLDDSTNDKDHASALFDVTQQLLRAARRPNATVLVTIDQLEEALDPAATRQTRRLLTQLVSALDNAHSPLMVIATLRSDFLHDLQSHPLLGKHGFEIFPIPPLTVAQFTQIVEGPAAVAGIELESGLVQAMIDDTRTIDALPLLAFTLRELWERHGHDGRLTIEEYRDKLGGLDRSVARAAEAVLRARPVPAAELQALRTALLMLVRINEEGQFARQLVHWSDFPVAAHALLERFIAARLLVAGHRNDQRIVEVAHEALFRAWQRLKHWLDEDRHALRLRESIRHAAAEWQEGNCEAHFLVHRGARLQAAEMLLDQPQFALSDLEQRYMSACVELRDAEVQAQRARDQARRRRLELTAIALLIGLVGVSVLGLWAMRQREDARQQLASLHWVTAVNERDRNHDGLTSSHHFMRAAVLTDHAASARSGYFAGALQSAGIALTHILEGHSPVRALSTSPDWQRVATGGEDGDVRIWALASGRELALMHHEGPVRGLRFSSTGRSVLSWSRDGTARQWDAQSGEQTALMRHEKPVRGAVYSPDETAILTWSNDGKVRLWRSDNAAALGIFAHEARVIGARFNADGSRVLSWSRDGSAKVWEASASAAKPLFSLRHDGLIGLATTAHWRQVLSWDRKGELRIWTRTTSGYSNPKSVQIEQLEGARYFANGTRVLTWSRDGQLAVWDAIAGKKLRTMRHMQSVRRAVLSSDEHRILSWSDDGSARVWDSQTGDELVRAMHQASVRGASFTSNEDMILTWSDDGRAQLWDSVIGQALGLPMAHAARVRGAIADEQSRRIISWSDDGSTRIWSRISARPLLVRLQHDKEVQGARFSRDARRVLTWSGRMVRLWSSDSGELLRELKHDAPVQSAAFSSDESRILMLGIDGHLLIAEAHGERVRSIAIRGATLRGELIANARWILAREDMHSLQLLSSADGHALTPVLRHPKSPLGILGIELDRQQKRLLSWGDDGSARMWRIADGVPLVLSHRRPVRGATVSNDGKLILTWTDEPWVQSWDINGGQQLMRFPHDAIVLGVSRDAGPDRFLSWDAAGALRLWNHNGQSVQIFQQPSRVLHAAVSASGEKILSSSDDGSVRIWQATQGGAPLTPVMRHSSAALAAFTPGDHRVLSWSEDGSVRLWDSRNGQPLTPALQHLGPVHRPRMSHDEQRILAWSGRLAQVWNLPPEVAAPAADAELQHAVRTGTRLNSVGDTEVLTREMWDALRAALAQGDSQ